MYNQPATNNLPEANPQADMQAQTVEIAAMQKLISQKFADLQKKERNPIKKLVLVFKKRSAIRKAKSIARSSNNMYTIN